ncbi:MAG: hypothetical protein QME35_04460 [Thermoanaerobacteraceae bacterium]|nr:hypothetical protein [Thermoanaerobacteraceae bacterium]
MDINMVMICASGMAYRPSVRDTKIAMMSNIAKIPMTEIFVFL